jgi:hypothetical protein
VLRDDWLFAATVLTALAVWFDRIGTERDFKEFLKR